MSPGIEIRPETSDDRMPIRAIHDCAFDGTAESSLVDRLREEGDLLLSLVAIADEPVGHVAFSRLVLPGSPVRASALGPLGVVPDRQRQGIGTALVREGLRRLSASGEDLILVLGDPDYYGRFGFRAEIAVGFKTPYDGPYLQALALSDQGRGAHGPVHYARAFAELS